MSTILKKINDLTLSQSKSQNPLTKSSQSDIFASGYVGKNVLNVGNVGHIA